MAMLPFPTRSPVQGSPLKDSCQLNESFILKKNNGEIVHDFRSVDSCP